MASMREAANRSYDDKLGRMGLKIRTAEMGENEGRGHVLPDKDGTQGKTQLRYADGYGSQEEIGERTAEHKAKPARLDRKGYKHGGRVKKGTTVNVIVAPQNAPKVSLPPGGPGMGAPAPMPPGPPAGGPPMPSPAGGPPMGGPPPMGMPPGMPHARGGRAAYAKGGKVPMNAGAGSGVGRLEKVKEYGARAKSGGKAGTM